LLPRAYDAGATYAKARVKLTSEGRGSEGRRSEGSGGSKCQDLTNCIIPHFSNYPLLSPLTYVRLRA